MSLLEMTRRPRRPARGRPAGAALPGSMSETPSGHVPVLADELLELLDPKPGQTVIDCTFGDGGHARLLAARLGSSGTLVAIDRDPLAEERFRALAPEMPCSARFIRAGYAEGLELLLGEGVQADAAYFDLGMSSMQVDTRARGFSYSYRAPLDMRMDPGQELTAREIVADWDERRLAHTLRDFGEERHATAIARAIVRQRAGRADRDHARARRHDQLRDSGPRAVRRRASGQARLPGAADRRQRRARTAGPRAPARLAAVAQGGRARGDLVPLARGSPRQALPRRPRARLHLPARAAGVRLRARARGGPDRRAARSCRAPRRSRAIRGRPRRACVPQGSSLEGGEGP